MKKIHSLSLVLCTIIGIALVSCGQPEVEEPFLKVSPESLSFDEDGGQQTISISANGYWNTSVFGSPFSVSPKSGEGNAEIVVTAQASTSVKPESGFITIKCGDLSAKVICTIAGSEAIAKEERALEALNKIIVGSNYSITQDKQGRVTDLYFNDKSLKGSLPKEIGDFKWLKTLTIKNEPDLIGDVPAEIGNCTNLMHLRIERTSLTSLPDVFSDMKELIWVYIIHNEKMTGPLPESLGIDKSLSKLNLIENRFTGSIPRSWGKLENFVILSDNCLSGPLPEEFAKTEHYEWLLGEVLWQKKGYGFDIDGMDIHGGSMWPETLVMDVEGDEFSFKDVIEKSRYTVYLIWASWCPFSKELMPRVKDYYEAYHKDGLEIIATSQVGGVDEYGAGHLIADFEGYKNEVMEKGYNQWYNFYWPDYSRDYLNSTPNAEVYDNNGNIVFSSFHKFPDPVRNRFSKLASKDLISFLETIFGPEEQGEVHTSTDFSADGQVMTLQTATVGNGINIVFMGDGYTDQDMASGGLYETVMRQAMAEFFAEEPYKTFRNRFNVYAVKVVSKNNWIGEGYSTALSTFLGEGSRVGGDTDKCYEYALKVPGIDSRDNLLVTVLLNSRDHGGTTYMNISGQTSVAFLTSNGNDPSLFGSTLQHEAGGHGLAFLADEYSSSIETAPQEHIAFYNEMYEKYGWYSNVDFTNDSEKIRWSAFLKDDRYKGQVGIFEGGALYTYGTYRPTANSIMRMDFDGFNAPSRWAIYKRIMELSGENYSFETFLEYDEVNRRAAASQTSVRPPLKAAAISDWQPDAPPVIVP